MPIERQAPMQIMHSPRYANFAYRPAMPNRIKALRTAAGWTQQELADRLDVDKATVWRYESNTMSLLPKIAFELARVLGLKSPEELLDSSPMPVHLIGEVGAGAQVFPLDDANEWLASPPDMVDPTAVRVVGRSMMPVYRPGDVLFAERRSNVTNDVVGQDCIVQVRDGARLVKRVHAGVPGMFRLYSYDTQDETEDLRLDWASPIRWISR